MGSSDMGWTQLRHFPTTRPSRKKTQIPPAARFDVQHVRERVREREREHESLVTFVHKMRRPE
jgi:hypothetical protein